MKKSFLFLVLIFLINLPGLYYQWYLNYWWFDMTLHFLGGFLVAMFFTAYLKERLPEGNNLKNALIIVGAAMFVGVVWEFAEYIANQTLIEFFSKYLGVKVYFMGNLDDTISDLTMDMLGALSFSVFWLKTKVGHLLN